MDSVPAAVVEDLVAAIPAIFTQQQRLVQNMSSFHMQVGLPIALGGLAAVIIQTLYRVRCAFGSEFSHVMFKARHSTHADAVHACRNRGAFPTISTRSDFAVIFVFLAAYKLDKDSLSWTV